MNKPGILSLALVTFAFPLVAQAVPQAKPIKLATQQAPGAKRGIDQRAYGFYTQGANQNVLKELSTIHQTMGVYDVRNYVMNRYNEAWSKARSQGIKANDFQRQWDQNKW